MVGDAAERWQVEAAESGVSSMPSAMLDAVEDAVLLCEASDGRIIDANLAGCRLLGCSRESCGESSLSDCSALEEGYTIARAVEHLQRALATGSTRFDWRSQRPDGSRFWSEVRAVRAPGAHAAERALVIAVVRDSSAERATAEALRGAQERYRGLVQNLPRSAVILCDHELRLVLVDGPEVEANGFSKAAMEGKTIFEVLTPDFARLVEGNLRRVLRGESFSAELPFRNLSYVYNYLPIRDAAGAVQYGMILAVNVTEQRRAQEALQKSEERLARIVQTAPEPMSILREQDSVITYVNPAFETLFGWPSENVIGRPTTELNAWSDPDQRTTVLEEFRRERRVDSTLVKVRTRDGRLLEGLLSLRPIEVEGVACILTSFRDISELQGTRAELETSEARLRALSEATFEGIGILHQGVVTDTNEQLAAMYATTREALLGRKVTDLVAPESLDLVRSRIEQRVQGAYEHLAIRADGSIFPVEVRARSLVLGGRTMRVTAIRDMTDRKRADAERERLIGELQARNAEMEQFTYTVSHDLKSPLVTISGFLGAIERDLRDGNLERAASDLNRIRSAAARMSALLNDLLELSRVGRVGGPLEPVAMAGVAREAAELVAGSLGDGRIQLAIAADLPVVRGDRARLVQVLQNLFDNAAKYMGDQKEPRVEVGLRPDEEHWVFYVRDNGIGIDPKYAERIFGLFEKLDPKSAGTGIGLALVRRIIEFHGGRIWVESDGHHGSAFCFRLPRGAGSFIELQGRGA